MSHHLPTCIAALAIACAPLVAQSSANVALESTIPHQPCTTGDVWAMGNYMLIARRYDGFAVVDISDPNNPVSNTIRPPGYPASTYSYGIGDVKSDGRYIYATDEATGRGGFIYDTVPDPMNPTLVSTWDRAGVFSCHNCFVDGNTLYAQEDIIDITDKANPRWLARLPTSGLLHDIIVLDNRAYVSNWSSGIQIYDVSNPRLPFRIGSATYPNAGTHNMWPSEDRQYLYTTDENTVGGVGGYVRVWDISNLSAIQQVGQFKTGPVDSVVHNVHVWGDLLYIAYYKEGLRVCSIKDPANPVEIAHYDTYASTGSGCFGGPYAGCFGVYPWRRNTVLLSDMDTGGYVVRLDLVDQTFNAQSLTVPPGGTIDLNFAFQNQTTAPLDSYGIMVLTGIAGAPVLSPFVVDARTLTPSETAIHNTLLPLPAGIPTPLPITFSGFTGTSSPLTISQRVDLTITVQ